MAITDIRKGDVVTWNGRTWLVTADPIRVDSWVKSIGQPGYWVQWVEYSGETYLRDKLIGGETLIASAPVEVVQRGVEMTLPWDEMPPAEADLKAATQAKAAFADVAEGSDEQFRQAVRTALQQDVPVRRIQQLTGLSRARIYQIRDGRR
jgi:hypothetical protein